MKVIAFLDSFNTVLLISFRELADLMLKDNSDVTDEVEDAIRLGIEDKPLQRHYFEKSRCCE